MRKQYPAPFKINVVLEVIKGELTMAQILSKHGVHQSVRQVKKLFTLSIKKNLHPHKTFLLLPQRCVPQDTPYFVQSFLP